MNLSLSYTDATANEFATNVARLIQVALSANASQADRYSAYQFLENFRSTATPIQLCTVGFILTSSTVPEVVLAGFQFIENVVTFSWDQFSSREELKERLCNLLKENQNPVFATNYVQESLARVIVEIGKKEWPQLWPNLIPDLCEMAKYSDIPLLILRRLVEDVGTLQRVDCTERRHELSQSLNRIAPDVLSTLFNILLDLWTKIDPTNVAPTMKRIKVTLNSLLPYIEWVNPLLFSTDDRIPILYALIKFNEVKMEAISCIMQLVERKPLKKEDKFRVPLECLTSVSINLLKESVANCAPGDLDYLRKVGTILSSLAYALPPDQTSMGNLIDGIVSLSKRPEPAAVACGAFAYNCLLRNVDGSKFERDDLGILTVMETIVKKFFQPPDPREKEDMDNLKSQFSQILRMSAKLNNKLYANVSFSLRGYLESQAPVEKYIWEALAFIVDAIASNVSHEEADIIELGLNDLSATYKRYDNEQDLELKSTILSTVSSLFVFLSLAKQRVQFYAPHLEILNQIVVSLLKNYTVEESLRGLRHHTSSLFIKLASKYPEVLVMTFDSIHEFIMTSEQMISLLERQSLVEALLIISNAWNDTGKQSRFIGSVLREYDWTVISSIIATPKCLLQVFDDPDFMKTKAMMTCNISILYAVLRRIKVTKVDNIELPDHPGYNFIRPLLPVIFQCVKTFHDLVAYPQLNYVFEMSEGEKSQVLGIVSSPGQGSTAFAKPLPVTSGFNVLASIPSPDPADSTQPKKIKSFVQAISDLCYGILGETCTIFSPHLYNNVPTLGRDYLQSVGNTMNLMSDFRVRTILRNVYRPFLLAAPISFTETIVKPFLQSFTPFMTQRLFDRWTAVENANRSPDGEEEKEVIESSVLRLLTKEYFELLQRLLERSAANESSYRNPNEDQMDMDGNEQTGDDTETASRPKPRNPNQGCINELGDVGISLLDDPTCFAAIVRLSIVGLCWDDSLVSFRAGRCLLLAWNVISKNSEAIHAIFTNALRCICYWTDNESNLDISVRIVDLIFKTFHQTDLYIVQSCLDWGAPHAEVEALAALCAGGAKNDKKRKDLIRKLGRTNPNLEKNRARKASWLSGLPKLIIQKDKPAQDDFDLNGCYSLIHS